MKNSYSIYILKCKGDVLYTGISNDVQLRYKRHCDGMGARFTRSHPPLSILIQAEVGSRSGALKMEYAVKRLPKAQKVAYIQAWKEKSGIGFSMGESL